MYIYQDDMPFMNRTIIKDIKNLKENDNVNNDVMADIKKFIDDLFNSKFLLAMLSRSSTQTEEAFSPYLINSDFGYILPIFTSKIEILREQDMFDDFTIYVDHFSNILLMYKALVDRVNGNLYISIDPFGHNYILDKEMIDDAIDIIADKLEKQ